MEILQVYPKDWHVRLEFSLTQVNQLLDFLDNCTVDIDPKNEELVKARDYVTKDFFPKLNGLSEDMKKGMIDGT